MERGARDIEEICDIGFAQAGPVRHRSVGMNRGAIPAALERWHGRSLAGRRWRNFPVPVPEQGIFSFFRVRRVGVALNSDVKTIGCGYADFPDLDETGKSAARNREFACAQRPGFDSTDRPNRL